MTAYDFETFRVDFDTRQIFRGGNEVHVSPKAFQLLQKLIEVRPKALSKAAIHDHLWPSTFVAESNLPSIVNEIRRALDDDAHAPRYIRTVHAFGYSFVGEPVTTARKGPPAGKLVGDKGEFQLFGGKNIVGRDPEALVRIDDKTLSRQHAAITVSDRVVVEDLQSKNGTFVDGNRVSTPVQIRDGSVLEFGSVKLVYREISTTSTETLLRK